MAFEHGAEHDMRPEVLNAIAGRIGCPAEALHEWLRQARLSRGLREEQISWDPERLKSLEREPAEMQRAYGILRKAPAFPGHMGRNRKLT